MPPPLGLPDLFMHTSRCICPLCALLRLAMNASLVPMAVLGPDAAPLLGGSTEPNAAGSSTTTSDGKRRLYEIRTYGGGENENRTIIGKGKARANDVSRTGDGGSGSFASRTSASALAKLVPFLARPSHPPRRGSSSTSTPDSSSSSSSGSDTESDSSSQQMGTSYLDRVRSVSGYGRTKRKTGKGSRAVAYVPLSVDSKSAAKRPEHYTIDVLPENPVSNNDVKVFDDQKRSHAIPVASTKGSVADEPLAKAGAHVPVYAPTPSSTASSYSSSKSGLLSATPHSPPDHSQVSTTSKHSADYDFNRHHAFADNESIHSTDARHMLQGPDADLEVGHIVETAPFTLAHTRMELAVHVVGIAITTALILLSVWLTIADVKW